MTDIVERLRNIARVKGYGSHAEAADEILRLRSELEQCQQAAFQAMEWQEIADAPHETNVLLFSPGHGHSQYEVGWASSGRRVTLESGEVVSNRWWHGYATHWMPLPPPPQEGKP